MINRKLYWGLGVLIGLLIGATVFVVVKDKSETRQLEKELADAEKLAADSDTVQHAAATTDENTDTPMPDDTAAPSTRETAAKTIDSTEPIETDAVSADALDPSKMSRFGLGPYPEIPKEWNVIPNYWEFMVDSIEDELLCRVAIKMHNEGIRSKYGSVGFDPSTLLIIAVERGSVLIETEIDQNGEERVYRALAHPDDLSGIYTRQSEIPSHLKIVTAEEIGFDPYEYLGLQKP